jgi:Flp pilus assembly protein TadG
MIGQIRHLWRSPRGSVAVEFALLAPLLFTLLFGTIQIGLAMQAYNALRGIGADVVRHVAVENQKENRMTNEQVRLYATATAVRPPYSLASERVTVTVADRTDQRIAGVRELSLSVTYAVPGVLPMVRIPEVTIRHRQPLFVSQRSAG